MSLKKDPGKPFRATFFDRDGTLVHGDPAAREARRKMIERWSGRPLDAPEDLFFRVLGGRRLLTVENETAFWKEYFAALLRSQGIAERVESRAGELFSAYWLRGIIPYPETEPVLRWFREHGFLTGVISDTFPSLRLTIEAAGLGQYFDCYVCSDLVGTMKPDPRMYQTALDALGVCAEESLYADDYGVEADGARALGMTAFHVCRENEPQTDWDVASLAEIVAFLQ